MMRVDWSKELKKTSTFVYDDWLEFFRKIPAGVLVTDQGELSDQLPADGYAALQRWLDIFENPAKMDKLYRGRLDAKQEDDILNIAISDDDVAFYEALIKKTATQMSSSSASQQEMARLTQNMNIFRTQLREIKSRSVKKGTVLARVLEAASEPKRPTTKPKASKVVKKSVKKAKPTSVKKVSTAPKGAGAAKSKKTSVVPSKAKK